MGEQRAQIPIRSLWSSDEAVDPYEIGAPRDPIALIGSARRESTTVAAPDLAFFGWTGDEVPEGAAVAALEVAWEALEDAGVTRAEGQAGLFVAGGPEIGPALAAELGPSGPTITVGQGLLAAHLACQALRDGDVDLAIAIGPAGDGLVALVFRRASDAVRGHDRILDAVVASGAGAGPSLRRRLMRRAGTSEPTSEIAAAGLDALLRDPPDGLVVVRGPGAGGSVVLLLEDPVTATAWTRAGRPPASTFEPVFGRPPAATPIPAARGGQVPRPTRGAPSELQSRAHVLLVSGRSEAAARARASDIAAHLAGGADLTSVAGTLATRRVHFEHRVAAPVRQGGPADALTRAPVSVVADPSRPAPVAFVFTGEGTHRPAMAAELYDVEPVFRETLNRCDLLLRPHMERPLLTVLFPRAPRDELRNVALAQPTIFAVQFALAELWRYWGVAPSAVLGYGLGEYVAATVAGVLRLEDALALVAARARLLAEHVSVHGAMAIVRAPEARVAAATRPYADRVAIAAVNTAAEVVVSGHRPDVHALLADFAGDGVETRLLGARIGLHSPHVEPALDAFEEVAALAPVAAPRIRWISGRTAAPVEGAPDAAHWRAQLRDTVRFPQAVRALLDGGIRHLVEIGPKPLLARMVAEVAPDAFVAASMRPDRDDHATMLDGLAGLWLRGARVDGAARYGGREPAPLPPYPWQRGPEAAGLAYDEDDSFQIDLPPVEGPPPVDLPAEEVPEPTFVRPPGPPVGRLGWRALEPAAPSTRAPSTWLVLADGEGVGDYVGARLAELGHDWIRVRPEAWARGDGTVGVPDPADPVAWRALVERLQALDRHVGVLHLWTLDVLDDAQPDAFAKAQALGPAALVHLDRALREAGRSARVWVVTRGAAPRAEEVGAVVSATAPGAAQALWPDAGWIDLDPLDEDPDAVVEAALADDARAVVLRDGQRFGFAREEAEVGAIQVDGTWLVVAPFAGALEIARALVARGVRRIVLASSARPDADGVKAVMALQPVGGRVAVVPADPTRPDALDRLLLRLEHEPPVVGAVVAPGGLDADDWPTLRRAALPWVRLGWTLHERGVSELVAIVPDGGLGGSTVAAALAGLVRHRLARGLSGAVAVGPVDAIHEVLGRPGQLVVG